jgi:hypothetical protein
MENPYLHLIEPSNNQQEALIFLNGYQMKRVNNRKLWCDYLRQANWQGSIYQLWWDSGSEYGR